MKFKVSITGTFNNIKGLKIPQKYYLNVTCGACNTPYDKQVFITKDNVEDYQVKKSKFKIEHCNLKMACKNQNCNSQLLITIREPENKVIYDEEEEEGYYYPVIGDSCHISTVISDSAVVANVDGLILDVVSMQDEIIPNCEFSKRILAEDDKKGRTVDITNFDIAVSQLK